jgi:hypothetical protein
MDRPRVVVWAGTGQTPGHARRRPRPPTQTRKRDKQPPGLAGTELAAWCMSEADLERGISLIRQGHGYKNTVHGHHSPDSRLEEEGMLDWMYWGPCPPFVMFRENKTMAEAGHLTGSQQECFNALAAAGADVAVWTPMDLLTGRIAAELGQLAGVRAVRVSPGPRQAHGAPVKPGAPESGIVGAHRVTGNLRSVQDPQTETAPEGAAPAKNFTAPAPAPTGASRSDRRSHHTSQELR